MACFKKKRLDLSEGPFYNVLYTNTDFLKKWLRIEKNVFPK
jgi:hypothetical protein